MTSPEPDLRHVLARLPEPPLPDLLWSRVDAARARRTRRVRGVTAAGVAALVACAVAVPLLHAPDAARPQQQAIAVPAAPAPATELSIADLKLIDRALQAAYARGASDDEIDPLWQVRRKLATAPPQSDANGI